MKTYPGVDINSDHNSVVMDFKMQRFKKAQKAVTNKKIAIDKLKDQNIKKIIQEKLEDKLKRIEITQPLSGRNMEWCKECHWKYKRETLGWRNTTGRKNRRLKYWSLWQKRREQKNDLFTKYKTINNLIKRKCKDAKETWLSEKCTEIENLQKKHDTFNVHKKIKEMTGLSKKATISVLRDRKNEIITETKYKLKRWKEYIEHLFSDNNRQTTPPTITSDINEIAPEITRNKVIYAIKAQKNKKATGPDNTYAEVIQLIAEEEGSGLDALTALYNSIYKTGILPADWFKSTFITLPKKSNASNCDDY